MAPVLSALAAVSNPSATSVAVKPNLCVIIGFTSTRLLAMRLRHRGYVLAYLQHKAHATLHSHMLECTLATGWAEGFSQQMLTSML